MPNLEGGRKKEKGLPRENVSSAKTSGFSRGQTGDKNVCDSLFIQVRVVFPFSLWLLISLKREIYGQFTLGLLSGRKVTLKRELMSVPFL